MKYFGFGLLTTIALLVVLFQLPPHVADQYANFTFQPSVLFANSLPGGKENPLNLIVILVVQSAVYGLLIRGVVAASGLFKRGKYPG